MMGIARTVLDSFLCAGPKALLAKLPKLYTQFPLLSPKIACNKEMP